MVEMRQSPHTAIGLQHATWVVFLPLFFASAVMAGDASADITESRRNAIVAAIEKVSPAVVSINVVEIREQRQAPLLFPEFWDIFELPRPAYPVQKRRLNSVGSGFFLDREGYVVTNYHVLEGASDVATVTLSDGRELPAEVVGYDERTDLAVLRIQGERLPRVTLGRSSDLMTGEWVIAIGNPFGPLMKDPQPTVSVGVVSANHRRVSPSVGGGERLYQDMIQTDAAINPGNSGGPLVNGAGEVVGVNTMIFSPSGGNVGLGFAIPIDRARRVVDEIIRYGRRRDPWPGFKVDDIHALHGAMLQELGVTAEHGCLVRNILQGCPAYVAGLRPADVIVAINGQPIETATEIDFAFWGMFVGDSVSLTIDRQGRQREILFAIEELTR
jgi:serine protease Do